MYWDTRFSLGKTARKASNVAMPFYDIGERRVKRVYLKRVVFNFPPECFRDQLSVNINEAEGFAWASFVKLCKDEKVVPLQ